MKRVGRLYLAVLGILFLQFSIANAQILNPPTQQGTQNGNINSLDDLDYGQPKELEIADISITGAKTLNHNALISLTGLQVGDKIQVPGPAISDAINKLWNQGIIGNVKISATKIEDGKIYLNIQLTERARLTKFEIKGVNSTQESELDEDLELIRGRVVTDALINNAKRKVEDFFIDKGFLNVDVDITQTRDTLISNSNSIALQIDVDKKQKVKIQNINVKGNEIFTDSKLVGQMKNTNERVRFTLLEDMVSRLFNTNGTKIKNFFTKKEETSFKEVGSYLSNHVKLNIFNTSKFIADDYQADKDKIIEYYNSKGYRDAKVVSDSVYDYSENLINIDLTVDEGQRYYFGNIAWSGNYIYEDQTLQNVLGINKGDVYDQSLLQKRLNYNPTGPDVSALYMDNGYLFFNVQPVETSIQGDSIDIEMRVFEGEQATIDEVIINGNDRTNDHVIRREIRTLPGEKFSRQELIRTQRELSQLGYFDPEQIGIEPIPNPQEGTVDIEYNLVERPSDQIELSGGWGGYYGFVGTVGITFNNFSIRNIPDFDKWRPLPVGDGQKLSLRVQANGKRFQNYSATFSEPWLGGKKPNNFTINLNRSVQRNYGFGGIGGYGGYGGYGGGGYGGYGGYGGFGGSSSDSLRGSLKMTGATVSLGRRVQWPDDYFTFTNSVSYMLYDLFNYGTSLGFSTGQSNSITLENTIARNSIDNPMFPRRGSEISLKASFTPPYSVFNDANYANMENEEKYEFVEYHKWMFDAKYYTRVIGDLVFATKAHFGFIGSYSDEVDTGPFERFYLGGDGMTGTNFLLGSEIVSLRGYENRSIVPIDDQTGFRGGTAYNKFTMELRYPLSLKQSATIYGLAFLEAGNNVNNMAEFNPFENYRAAGFGARIFMPAFGLLGVDWGYGFDPAPGQTEPSGGQFHFTIGQQIR